MNGKESNIKDIMLLLVDSSQPLTVKQLSSAIQVSEKTVRNYLEEIADRLAVHGIELMRKPNAGTYLKTEQMKKDSLRRFLQAEGCSQYSPEYRQKYILKVLFKNRYTYTIQLLAEDLGCSKNTIVKDLTQVQEWLEQHGLSLQRKTNQGLWIEGSEKKFRAAMMSLFSVSNDDENRADMYPVPGREGGAPEPPLDYRMDATNYRKIKKFFPNLDFGKIQTVLQTMEDKLGYYFTDQAFINLVVHIAITLERVKFDRKIDVDYTQYEFLKENKEYGIAVGVVRQLSQDFKLAIPEEESFYICLHMLGAKIQEDIFSDDIAYGKLIHAQPDIHHEIAHDIIALVSDVLGVDLSRDEVLLSSLIIHLRPTIIRLRHGLNLRNPLLQKIKEDYVSIFGATWSCNSIFEKKLGFSINEDEVAYITLHIAVAVERLQDKRKVLVVCSSGIGTSQLVAQRLKKRFPEIEISGVIPLIAFSPKTLEDHDLVISTVPIPGSGEKIVYVTTFIDEKDVATIQAALSGVRSVCRSGDSMTALPVLPEASGTVLTRDYCFLDAGDRPYLNIIETYVAMMARQGIVKPGFFENLVEREHISSTVIGKGIAIPHGREEFVARSQIALVILDRPVNWSGQRIDIIFILALKFQDIQSTKRFFKKFYSLLDNEAIIRRMKQDKNIDELLALFS